MKNSNNDFLSIQEVNLILNNAWQLSSSPNRDMQIEQLRLSDWNVLQEDIKIVFGGSEFGKYKISTYSGEAYYKLVGKSLSKKARAIYTLVLFILIKRGKLDSTDKDLLHNFQNARNHFLQIYFLETETETTDKVPLVDQKTIADGSQNQPPIEKFRRIKIASFLLVLISMLLLSFIYYFNTKEKIKEATTINDPNIKLKILTNQNGFYPPCDITFEYDLTSNHYKEASLSIMDDLIPITSPKGQYVYTFTDPLVTEASLKIDNKIKKLIVPIYSGGWLALADNYNIPLKLIDGVLHHDINSIPAPVLSDGTYYVNYMNINNFDINGDNMIFETRVKNPKNEGGISCFDIAIDINGSTNLGRGILSFNLLSKGCERYAKIKVGDLSLPSAEISSLIKSGIDPSDWIIVRASTKNGFLTISVDDQLLYNLKYNGSIGDVKVMQIGFKGSGSVDWVTVKSHEGKLLYEELFEKTEAVGSYSYED